MSVKRASHQKHLDKRSKFRMYIKPVLSKVNKGISIINKLRHTLPRKSLLTINKAFWRPHFDYGKPSKECFREKLELVQQKAALAITDAVQSTSREKSLIELGLESLKSRR